MLLKELKSRLRIKTKAAARPFANDSKVAPTLFKEINPITGFSENSKLLALEYRVEIEFMPVLL
jgi:hypothetical protein